MLPSKRTLTLIFAPITIAAIFLLKKDSQEIPAAPPEQEIATQEPFRKSSTSLPSPNNSTPPASVTRTHVEKLLQSAALLHETSEVDPISGAKNKTSVYRTDFKYPLVQVEEQFHPGANSPHAQLVSIADHAIVRFPAGWDPPSVDEWARDEGLSMRRALYTPDTYLIAAPNSEPGTVAKICATCSTDGSPAIFAEPDYIVFTTATPDDPRFEDLWGLQNTGQAGGTAGADISAGEAWNLSTGSSDVIVAVIDTGVDATHQELAPNIWTNPGETAGNGIDDDGNGLIDDTNGWDFYDDDKDPSDEDFHGTHVAGTIGAAGNNTFGVVGVAWNVSLLPIRFLGPSGGTTSDAIDCITYSTTIGADLSSNSWGGGGFSTALHDAINAANDADILFVAAAGNDSLDSDQITNYPSGYEVDNIISVASTTRNDTLSDFSNYGASSVDLGAPGSEILSTSPANSFRLLSGTSMATPHVSGVCALIKSLIPDASAALIKETLFDTVDPLPALSGITTTGGRMNAFAALQRSGIPILTLAQSNIFDDTNGDGIPSPGETLKIAPTIQKFGIARINDVVATLRQDPGQSGFILSTTTISLGDMALPGSTSTPAPGFEFSLSIDSSLSTPSTGIFIISLTGTPEGGTLTTWEYPLDITALTTSTLAGTVTEIGNGAPVPSASVMIQSPASTQTVATDSNGAFSATVTDGTHSLTASALGYITDAPATVVSPGDSINISLFLGSPAIAGAILPLPAPLLAGDRDTTTLLIENDGDVPLEWQLGSISQANALSYTLPTAFVSGNNPDLVAGNHATDSILPQMELFLSDLTGISIYFHVELNNYAVIINELRERGAIVTSGRVLSSSQIPDVDIIITDDSIETGSHLVDALRTFTSNGGSLLVSGDNPSSLNNVNALLHGTGITAENHSFLDAVLTDILPHPTTESVFEISALAYGNDCILAPSSAAIPLIALPNGNYYAVASSLGSGRIIAAGNEILSSSSFTSPDSRIFAHQVIGWLARTSSWLTLAETSGTIAPGSSQTVTALINTQNLAAGPHSQTITLTSNAPGLPNLGIPFSITVNDAPSITPTPEAIAFGEVLAGVSRTAEITLESTGTEPLTITSVTLDGAGFTSPVSVPFTLDPGASSTFPVELVATDEGSYSATLSIVSNDPSDSPLIIPLSATALLPPAIAIEPTLISAEDPSGQVTEIEASVANTGGLPLEWSLSSVDFPDTTTASPTLLNKVSVGFILGDNTATTSGYSVLRAALAEQGAIAHDLPRPFSASDLQNIEVIWLNESQTDLTSNETDALEAWFADGAGLFIEKPNISGNLLSRIGSSLNSTNNFNNVPAFTNNFGVHPVTSEISTIQLPTSLPFPRYAFPLSTSSQAVVTFESFNTTISAVAAENLPGGRLLAASFEGIFTPPQIEDTDADNLALGLQAISWLSQAPPQWLSLSSIAGSISSGDSESLGLTTDSRKLVGGTYTANITIASNDPITSEAVLPVTLTLAGVADLAATPSTLDLGSVQEGGHSTALLNISNPGSASITVTGASISGLPFSVDTPTPFTLPAQRSIRFPVKFSPIDSAPHMGTLTLTTDATSIPTLEVALVGMGIPAPDITSSLASLSLTAEAGSTSAPQTLTISNDGLAPLHWNMHPSYGTSNTSILQHAVVSPQASEYFTQSSTSNIPTSTASDVPLENFLPLVDQALASVTSSLGDLFLFEGGEEGQSITSGIYSSYGNTIRHTSSSFGNSLAYSDRNIASYSNGSVNAPYFTAKAPGIFALASDISGISDFSVNGRVNYREQIDGSVISTIRNGVSYLGFVYRLSGGSDPSINHLIIVPQVGSPSHSFSTSRYSESHRVTGLDDIDRLYYLLFSGKEGRYITDTEMSVAMETFLDSAGGDWLLASGSGSIPAGDSTTIAISADATGLLGGDYTAAISITSNDPDESPLMIPVDFAVTGTPGLLEPDLDSSGLSFGNVDRGSSLTLPVTFYNPGTAPVTISNFSSGETAYSAAIGTTILPLRSGAVEITFTPDEFRDYLSQITLTTNGGAISIPVSGTGIIGDLHTLSWDPIPTGLLVNTPFSTRLTAYDKGENQVSTFQDSAKLVAFSPPVEIFENALTPADFATTQSIFNSHLGNEYIVDTDITITSIQHPSGVQNLTFWTTDGTQIYSFSPPSHTATWNHSLLPKNLKFAEGDRFVLTMQFTLSSNQIPSSPRIQSFPHGQIGLAYSGSGSQFPRRTTSTSTFPIGFSYAVGHPEVIPIYPGNTSAFSFGQWDGDVSLGTASDTIQLVAFHSDAAEPGLSEVFSLSKTGTITLSLPASVQEGDGLISGAGSVTITPVPNTDTTISLSSSSPADCSIPQFVVVPAGASTASFDVTVPDDFLLDGPQNATISARAGGYDTQQLTIDIEDNEAPNYVFSAPSAIFEGDRNTNITTTLLFPRAPDYDVTFTFTTDDASLVTAPAPITVFAGRTSASATFTILGNNLIGSDQMVTLTAASPGWPQQSSVLKVIEDDTLQLSLQLPTSLIEGASRTSHVTIPGLYPDDIIVNLTSSSPFISVPPSVVISAGSTRASFIIATLEDNLGTGTIDATISAATAVPGFGSKQGTITVFDNDPHHFRFLPIPINQRATIPFAVTVRAENPDGTEVTAFSGDVQLAASAADGTALTTSPSSLRFFTYSRPAGTWHGEVQLLSGASTPASLIATHTDSGATGTSNTFGITDPRISVTPGSLTLAATIGETITQELTLENTGSGSLNWYASSAPEGIDNNPATLPLQTILSGFEANSTSITDIIPHRFDFEGGDTGSEIGPGSLSPTLHSAGNSIFIDPVYYRPVSIPYSNGAISPLGVNLPGNYFTSKVPGLFVCVADVPIIRGFSITGSTAFPSNGTVSNSTFSTRIGSSKFKGYLRKNVGFPGVSLNQLFIVPDDGAIEPLSAESSTQSGSDFHELTSSFNRSSSAPTRIFHLLYATNEGITDDIEDFAIMRRFLEAITPETWLNLDLTTGSNAAGETSTLTASIDTTGLASGNYVSNLIFDSNDQSTPSVSIPVSLSINEPLTSYVWDHIAPFQISESQIAVRLSAQDALGKVITSYEGTADISLIAEGNPPEELQTVTFVAGVWEGLIRIPEVNPSVTLEASSENGFTPGISNTFASISPTLVINPEPEYTGGSQNTISWNELPSTQITEIQYDSDASFSNPIIGRRNGSTTFTTSAPLEEKAYYFRVRAVLEDVYTTTYGSWSAPVVSIQDKTQPTLLLDQPATSLTIVGDTPLLSGTISDISGISEFTILGNAVTVDPSGRWSHSFPAIQGSSQSISFVAHDGATPPNLHSHTITVNRPTDADSDFLPDDWESAHNFDASQDATADFDGDGISNLLEFLSGSDPSKAESSFEPTSQIIVTPPTSLGGDVGGTYLYLQYYQRRDIIGATIDIGLSTDMDSWDFGNSHHEPVSRTPVPGSTHTDTRSVRFHQDLSTPDASRAFIRLRAKTP